jgi:hypothetical protein
MIRRLTMDRFATETQGYATIVSEEILITLIDLGWISLLRCHLSTGRAVANRMIVQPQYPRLRKRISI